MPNGHGGIPFLGSPVLFAAIAGWRLAYHLHRAPPTNTTAPMPILRPMPTCAPQSAVVVLQMRKSSYHGIASQRINPGLRAWWEASRAQA